MWLHCALDAQNPVIKGLGPRTPELFMGFWASRAQCGHMDTFFDCRTFYQLVVQK